jgi:hypothetical protein
MLVVVFAAEARARCLAALCAFLFLIWRRVSRAQGKAPSAALAPYAEARCRAVGEVQAGAYLTAVAL